MHRYLTLRLYILRVKPSAPDYLVAKYKRNSFSSFGGALVHAYSVKNARQILEKSRNRFEMRKGFFLDSRVVSCRELYSERLVWYITGFPSWEYTVTIPDLGK